MHFGVKKPPIIEIFLTLSYLVSCHSHDRNTSGMAKKQLEASKVGGKRTQKKNSRKQTESAKLRPLVDDTKA